MLSTALKNGELAFITIDREAEQQEAREMLDTSVRELIQLMVSIERDDIYSRKEIEAYVLKRMEYYEGFLYGMDDDEYEVWLSMEIERKIRKRFGL